MIRTSMEGGVAPETTMLLCLLGGGRGSCRLRLTGALFACADVRLCRGCKIKTWSNMVLDDPWNQT